MIYFIGGICVAFALMILVACKETQIAFPKLRAYRISTVRRAGFEHAQIHYFQGADPVPKLAIRLACGLWIHPSGRYIYCNECLNFLDTVYELHGNKERPTEI
jgi:hypothetical protein